MAKLKEALEQIEKDFGEGSVMRMGKNSALPVETISTGSRLLNKALGVGGFPKGRIIEIYGPESSGKTTLALHAVAEAQKENLECAYIDTEHSLDPVYANAIGCDIDNLLISQPDSGEDALSIVSRLTGTGEVGLIVVDSVAALTPRAELEGEIGDSHVGLHARLMSQSMRLIVGKLNKTNTILVFINQLRTKIGVRFGSPEVTTGGRALAFYSSIRLDIRRIETLKTADEASGNKTRVKVVKNKVSPPHKTAEFEIRYGVGINKIGEIIELAKEQGIIVQKGSWFSLDGENLAQGMVRLEEKLESDHDLRSQIEERLA